MTIIEAINDPNLFKPLFKDISTWKPWIVYLKAVFALPMDRAELKLFRRCTGGRKPPKKEVKEVPTISRSERG